MKKSSLSAFTLIELLAVVTIIGILATIIAGSLLAAQRRSRDAQRKNQINLIAQGIDLYYASAHVLPGYTSGCSATTYTSTTGDPWIPGLDANYVPSSGSKYIIPKDPKNTAPYIFTYRCNTNASDPSWTYSLTAILENPNDPDSIDNPSTPGQKMYVVKH